VNTYTAKRIVTYVQPPNTHEPIQLCFADGTAAMCDVLVGADGLKSAVRASMMHERALSAECAGKHAEATTLRDCTSPRFSGAVVYRVLVPTEKLARFAPHHRTLASPHQVSLPIGVV
jgi:salicylate hydroxylase